MDEPVTTGQTLRDSVYQRRLEGSSSQRGGCWVPGAAAAEAKLVFHGTVSTWEEEKVLEMEGGDGCTTMWIFFV